MPIRDDDLLKAWSTAGSGDDDLLSAWAGTPNAEGKMPGNEGRLTQDSGAEWSPLRTLMSHGALGYGPEISAATQATKWALERGGSFDTWGKDYQYALTAYRNAAKRSEEESPSLSTAAAITGDIAGTVPAMLAGGAGLASAGNALLSGMRSSPLLARAAPTAASVGQFLTGAARGGPLGVKTLGSRLTAGAGSGAVAGGMVSHNEPETELSDQILTGAALGAGVGAGAPLLYQAGKRVGAGTKALVAPFTQSGREGIANKLIGEAAEGGNVIPASAPLPGSLPTLAQATDNPGLASIERQLRTMPGEPAAAFKAADDANQQVRLSLWQRHAGDDTTVQALKDTREAVTAPMRDAALQNARPVDPKSVVKRIDEILASPSGKRSDVESTLREVRNKLMADNPLNDRIDIALGGIKPLIGSGRVPSDAEQKVLTEARRLLNSARRGNIDEDDLLEGFKDLVSNSNLVNGALADAVKAIKSGPVKLETDAKQLYGVRKAIGDLLDSKAQTEKSKQAKVAAVELQDVRDALDRVLEKGAPGFKQYLRTFADMSRPIDAQRKLQSLNVTDASGNVTLGKLDAAIKNIEAELKKPGAQRAKAIEQDTLDTLQAMREDLRLAANSRTGKAMGSDTIQNAAMHQFMKALGVDTGLGSFIGNAIARPINMLYKPYNEMILNQLTQKMLSPATAVQLPGVAAGGQGVIGNALTGPGLPRIAPALAVPLRNALVAPSGS